MNPFQNVSFDSVEELLDFLPLGERKIVEQLREIVFACIPDTKEKLSYNVPFYYRHTRICFIWPGSVPWGGVKEGVLFGFCKGHQLSNSSDLETGTRKSVFTKTFHTSKEIDREKVSQLLYEAVWIDEEVRKEKTTRQAKKHQCFRVRLNQNRMPINSSRPKMARISSS